MEILQALFFLNITTTALAFAVVIVIIQYILRKLASRGVCKICMRSEYSMQQIVIYR